MIEFLSDNILWWHWIILGFILLLTEMTLGTILLLGLAVASILVGLLDIAFHLSFSLQIILWTLFSIISFILWKKLVIPKHSTVGQSNYNLDTIGTVIEEIAPHKRGKVRFDTPVLGNTTWTATADEELSKELRIKIVEIKGQLIKVAKI